MLSFVIGTYSYQNINRDKIISHWNAEGQEDGYMSKFWGIFLVPLMLIGLYLLFLVIPKIDPLKENIKKFRGYYDSFILVIILFLFYIFILTILANFGYNFNLTLMLMPALGILFFYIGIILKKLKRNWFIGIRTPWTMSNDEVWDKTHKLGSILFKIIGVILVFGIFFPTKYFIWFILIPIFVLVIWLTLYSYIEFKKNNAQKHIKK
jgi:uncharacterized membrane protein